MACGPAPLESRVLCLWSEARHPRANQLPHWCMTKPASVTIADAAHFMVMIHATELAEVILKHVPRTEPVMRKSNA